jgi:hypothetical protein
MADHGGVRALRAVVFTAVCVLLTTLGHGLSAGAAPAAASVLTGGALLLVLAWYLASRERSLAQLLTGVLAAQVGMHLLFSAVTATETTAVAEANLGSAAHPGHELAPVAVQSGESLTIAMLLAHLAAGLVAAWWLRQGETAVWELSRSLAAVAAVPFFRLLSLLGVAVATVAAPLGAVPIPARPVRLPGLVLLHAVVRRGPPALLVR